jgi:hypothetical protein
MTNKDIIKEKKNYEPVPWCYPKNVLLNILFIFVMKKRKLDIDKCQEVETKENIDLIRT